MEIIKAKAEIRLSPDESLAIRLHEAPQSLINEIQTTARELADETGENVGLYHSNGILFDVVFPHESWLDMPTPLNTARLEAEARRADDDDNRPARQPRDL